MKLTKELILESSRKGEFLNRELESMGVDYKDMDGKKLRIFLESLGFRTTDNYDTGKNGLVFTMEGVCMSTNGYVSRGRA